MKSIKIYIINKLYLIHNNLKMLIHINIYLCIIRTYLLAFY